MQTIVQEKSACAYYVYGIVAQAETLLSDLPAVEPDAPVICLREGDLAAVVSPVALDRFDPDQMEARLTDLAWLEPRVRAHQSVLAAIVGTVAPLRFGTIFHNEAGVRTMLQINGPLFRRVLERIQGCREWGLKIYADPQRVADYVRTTNIPVKNLIAQRNRLSSGAAYMIQRKLDLLLLEESRRVVEVSVNASQERLSAHAVATAGGTTTRRDEPGGPELIFSAAYLVDQPRTEPFLAELDALVADYTCVTFEISGPWPAYSFVTTPDQELA